MVKLTPQFVNRTGWVTYEEFRSRVADGDKADLIDGVIFMASPENTDANDLFVWFIRLIAEFLENHDMGKVYGSRVAMKLDNKNSPEPDVSVVLKDRLPLVERGHILGPADLCIEIVSPESVQRDYEKKRKLYERFGVKEYWIVDEDLQVITVLVLGPKGYREMKSQKRILVSSVLPGFSIDPKWVWANPRPRVWDCLQFMKTIK